MPAQQRPVDILTGAFDLKQRRKFTVKNDAGEPVLDLYVKPITRSDRLHAMSVAGSDDALQISTALFCQMAELENGTKAFAAADAAKLQRELPEAVLNELELFMFSLGQAGSIEDAKKD